MIQIPRAGQIALVDDDDLDRMIISRVLKMSNLDNQVVDFASGEALISELEQRDGSDLGLALILMDVNMAGMGGLDALAHIRNDMCLENLPPIFMLTSSESGTDMVKAEEIGAHGYLAKQSGIDNFVSVLNTQFENQT